MRQQIKIAKMNDWVNKGKTPATVFSKFQLKTMQKAILNCLETSDVVANLPTGFGKSLLFQYPASLQKINKTCILVIVPLKALLWDTIRQARQLNIVAQEIDYNVITDYYRNDKIPQMLVATPQKIFASENTLNFIQSLHSLQKIRFLVIDQCHCMCQWGHDFRPAYLQLQKLKQILTGVRLLAISATITPQTRIDLSKRLSLYTGHYFQASYHRNNLFYGILRCKGKAQFKAVISDYLKQKKLQQQPGIIYCQTIATAEQLVKQLSHLKVGLFHSKLSQKMRKQTYDGFMQGQIKIIVGTICFGMGINKKDIRYVINVGISKSPQNYYQQSGRAGRDGLEAQCIVVSFPNQSHSLAFLIGKGQNNNKQKTHQLVKLQQMKQYVQQQNECRRKVLFKQLGQNFNPENCGKKCDICKNQASGIKTTKIDYYSQAKKILQQLQTSRMKFTKKQLCNFLKGKAIISKKRGKASQLVLGQQISGIFSKQSLETIEKIVDTMINKNILVQDVKSFNSKYFINYYKAANKNSTRSFKQFFITIRQKPQIQDKKNKFSRFLQKKGASLQPLKKTMTLQQMAPKIEQQQVLMQADVIKSKENYESFFCQLFGQQLNIGLQKRQSGGQQLSEVDEQNIIELSDIPADCQEQPLHLQQQVIQQQNNTDTVSLTQLCSKQKLKKKQQLKRNKIDEEKLTKFDQKQF